MNTPNKIGNRYMLQYDYNNFSFEIRAISKTFEFFNSNKSIRHATIHEYILNAKFLDIDCSDFVTLCHIKSWVQTYLNNKIGTIKEKSGYDLGAGDWLFFDIRTRKGENYLYVNIKENQNIVIEKYYNYQEVLQLNLALGKCLQFVRPNDEWEMTAIDNHQSFFSD